MGKAKYEALSYPYALGDTPQLTKEQAKEAERTVRQAMESVTDLENDNN